MSTTGDGPRSIEAHDPSFDVTNFLAQVDQLRLAVRSAGPDPNLGGMARHIAPGLLSELLSESVDDPTSDPTSLVSMHSDASFDTVVVSMHHSGGVVDWTFQRSSSATTNKGWQDGIMCPQCGAPLKLDAACDCTYCKTPFTDRSDWVLVRAQLRLPDPSPAIAFAAVKRRSRAGLYSAGITIVVVAIIVVASVVGHSSHRLVVTDSSPTTNPAISPSPGPTAKSLDAHLTLAGAISLDPSELNTGEVVLNAAPVGTCPPATEPLSAVVLDVHFDDGSQMQGTFAIAMPLAAGGSADLDTGGTAVLHFIGPTEATQDDQIWRSLVGRAGAVTISTDASGGGTIKWQQLAPTETNHNSDDQSSGLLTWTCS